MISFLWDIKVPQRELEQFLWRCSAGLDILFTTNIMIDFATAVSDLCQRK